MTRTRSLAASFLSLSAAAALALAGAGSAAAAPSAPEDKSSPSVASATLDTSGAADYWTEDRMRAAIPGDVLAAKALERGNTPTAAAVEKGDAKKVKGTKGKPTLAVPETPVSHIGKVFFTLGGVNYVCSGNAVTSENRSTVATAGHCLNEGLDSFATKFIFVPGYIDGKAPYGEWAAHKLYTTAQWNASGDIQYDTGFAVVDPRADKALLTDVVGGSGVAFNAPRGLEYTAYGYPAARPFDGGKLWSCTGTATADTTNAFTTQGIPCDMTGGSSGGPWFIGKGSDGLQNSVNSYSYNRSPVMYGPYWGTDVELAYTTAQAA